MRGITAMLVLVALLGCGGSAQDGLPQPPTLTEHPAFMPQYDIELIVVDGAKQLPLDATIEIMGIGRIDVQTPFHRVRTRGLGAVVILVRARNHAVQMGVFRPGVHVVVLRKIVAA